LEGSNGQTVFSALEGGRSFISLGGAVDVIASGGIADPHAIGDRESSLLLLDARVVDQSAYSFVGSR
jgi:hypothetical protein